MSESRQQHLCIAQKINPFPVISTLNTNIGWCPARLKICFLIRTLILPCARWLRPSHLKCVVTPQCNYTAAVTAPEKLACLHGFVLVRKTVVKRCKVSSPVCCSKLNRTGVKAISFSFSLSLLCAVAPCRNCQGFCHQSNIMKKSSRLLAIRHVKLSLSFHRALCDYPETCLLIPEVNLSGNFKLICHIQNHLNSCVKSHCGLHFFPCTLYNTSRILMELDWTTYCLWKNLSFLWEPTKKY